MSDREKICEILLSLPPDSGAGDVADAIILYIEQKIREARRQAFEIAAKIAEERCFDVTAEKIRKGAERD